jgi:tetratricopeptide (TPR) repeat protein
LKITARIGKKHLQSTANMSRRTIMSRVDKTLRRKHRKEKKQKHSRIPREWISGEDGELPATVRLLSYTITDEPLDLAREKIPGLDEALEDIREQLFDDVHHHPKAAIPVLRRLLEQFPNAPMLLNWLASVMGAVGDIEECNRLAQQNLEANPNYLFARLDCAQIRLQKGDLDGVDEILDHKFDLKLLYPERDVFHLSEYRAFCGLLIPYYIRRGEFKAARLMFDALEQLEPNGEVTRRLRSAVEGSVFLEMARKMAGFAVRRGRLPG